MSNILQLFFSLYTTYILKILKFVYLVQKLTSCHFIFHSHSGKPYQYCQYSLNDIKISMELSSDSALTQLHHLISYPISISTSISSSSRDSIYLMQSSIRWRDIGGQRSHVLTKIEIYSAISFDHKANREKTNKF